MGPKVGATGEVAMLNSGERALLVCDESGSTGMDYLNPDQRVFVFAGWFIPQDRAEAMANAMIALKAHYPDSVELGASLLLKTPVGQQRAATFLRGLLSDGILPIAVIAEKREMVAAKIVDVFFDPMHNPAASWLPSESFAARKALAGRISAAASNALLADFARAYRSPAQQEMLGILNRLRVETSELGPEVIAAIDGARGAIATIVSEETFDGHDGGKHHQYASLNLPCLAQWARLANGVLRHHDMMAELVFDETATFGTVYTDSLSILHNNGREIVVTADGSSVVLSTERIVSWSPGDSTIRLEIQAADILAGVLAKVVHATIDGQMWPGPLAEVAAYLLGMSFLGPPHVIWLMCSEPVDEAIIRRTADGILAVAAK